MCAGSFPGWDGAKQPQAKGLVFLQVASSGENPAGGSVQKLSEALHSRETDFLLLQGPSLVLLTGLADSVTARVEPSKLPWCKC